MPDRIQLSRARGWRKPPGSVVVSRPSLWGNMFKVGALCQEPGPWKCPAVPYAGFGLPGTYTGYDVMNEPFPYQVRKVRDRADAVALFAAYIRFHDDEWPPEGIRRALAGRDLACWCPLPAEGEPDICHAAVLLKIANKEGGHAG